jgi:hypothetical protein
MLQESDIVFETENGNAWVIKRRSTPYEKKCESDPTCDPTPAQGTLGPHVWDVVYIPAFPRNPILDSTYTFESLAIARAKYIGDRK